MNNFYTILGVVSLLIIGLGTYAHVASPTYSFADSGICTTPSQPVVTAQAYFVKDLSTDEVLLEKNADSQLPLASLTKIMTALVARNSLNDTDVVSIPESALEPEGDSGLFAEELWNINDLTDFTLMTSSNDGAHALALLSNGDAETFISEMNKTAKELDLNQTFFLSDTGLDVSTSTAGAYGSARDIAHLMDHIVGTKSGLLDGSTQVASVFQSVSGFRHKAKHTSELPGIIPGSLIIKTGFTDLAGGNLAVLAELLPGTPVAIVVLGSTLDERENDVLSLAHVAKQAIKKAALCNSL